MGGEDPVAVLWTGSFRGDVCRPTVPLVLVLILVLPFLPFSTPRMSDSDGDFSDELLELAGATEKKRKRREGTSRSETKRRKAEYVVPPCLLYPVSIPFPT